MASTAPLYVNSGTFSNVGVANPTPGWPASPIPGATALMVGHVKNDGAATLTAPAGWTALGTVLTWAAGGVEKLYVWYKTDPLAGTETGTVTITQSGSTGRRDAIIHQFRGKSNRWNFVSVGTEMSDTAVTSMPDISVTTTRFDCLAVNVFAASNAQTSATQPDMSAATGGTWNSRSYGWVTGTNGVLYLYTCQLDSQGTINGGAAAITSSGYGGRGLYIYALPPTEGGVASANTRRAPLEYTGRRVRLGSV